MAKRAFGFKSADDGSSDAQIQCIALSGNADVLAPGDAVVLVGSTSGSGKIGTGPRCPAIARGAATGSLWGFVSSVDQASITPANFNRRHRPASTACYINVIPFKTFRDYIIRADAALTAEDVGENVNLATIADANTTLGLSVMEVSASTAATSQTAYQMTIIGIEDDGTNDITSTTPVIRVRMNNIQAVNAFAGV